jgi:hypothetical protein
MNEKFRNPDGQVWKISEGHLIGDVSNYIFDFIFVFILSLSIGMLLSKLDLL